MKIMTFLAAIAIVLTGCQSSEGSRLAAPAASELSPSAASAIASDLAARLAEQVAPKGTIIRLTGNHVEFAVALEAALKGWGYSIDAQKATVQVTPLDYVIEQTKDEALATLAIPSVVLSRTYLTSANGAEPRSPISVMRRD
jgi:ABC-type Fe3+-hydroxamate transport system substrate-binding protein